nr:Holliday junction resolvase [Wadden Sea poxvirus]
MSKKYNVIQREIVCAFDIGAKNPARTILEITNNGIKIIDISKLDWSYDWENRIAYDISQYEYNTVLLERQPKRSPYVKFIYFIKGFLYIRNCTKVICVSPVMSGNSYKDRKRRSINEFIKWMKVFKLNDYIPKRKLDDVADSFNLAMRYVLDKFNLFYIPYKKNQKKCKNDDENY